MERQLPASKVAIPRLHHPKDPPPRQEPKRKPRTHRACENCRKRKVRCSGEQDCRNCLDQGFHCVYPPARRDRLNEATEQNSRLLSLLKDLSLHVDDHGQKLIHDYLDTVGDDERAPASHPPLDATALSGKRSRESSSDSEQDRHDGPEPARISDQVDERHLTFLDEDLLRTSKARATGFIGVNSSMQWMRSLKTSMRNVHGTATASEGGRGRDADTGAQSTQGRPPLPPDRLRVSDSTFYLDCDDLELDNVLVDPFEVPQPEVLDRLFDTYMQTTHPSFPIVPILFQDQFRRYSQSLKINRPYQVSDEWLAMLNLVLAIGRKYSQLAQSDTDSPDHSIYMIRASRLLRLDKIITSLPSPTLSFIQSIGLLSLYYLVVGQVSRAWMMIGIALRFSLAAGLHLRNDDPSAPPNKNETLINTWWSLHGIESLLCAIIGRPCVILDEECTVPLPQSSNHPSPQLGSSSPHSSRDGSHDVTPLSKLYSPRILTDSWHIIQEDIISLMRDLDRWAAHARLAGLNEKSATEASLKRDNQLFSFHYLSAKILICRPCLCRLEGHEERSDALSQMKKDAAAACVGAALAMARLLPEQMRDLQSAYSHTPWWSIVHYIMQAVAVLLLKLLFGPLHAIHDGESIVSSLKKLLRWLRYLSSTSDVAERAYKIAVEIIQISVSRGHISVKSLQEENTPTTDPNSVNSQTPSSISTTENPPPVQGATYSGQYQQKDVNTHPPSQPEIADSNNEYTYTPHDDLSSEFVGDYDASQYFANGMLAQSFITQPDLLTPMYFGNPFFTHFDQANMIFGDLSANVDVKANADVNTDVNMDAAYGSFLNQWPNR